MIDGSIWWKASFVYIALVTEAAEASELSCSCSEGLWVQSSVCVAVQTMAVDTEAAATLWERHIVN